MQALDALTGAITRGDLKQAVAVTQQAISAGTASEQLLAALMAGMDDVGRRFKADEIFVPDVLLAARAMKGSMELLEPLLARAGLAPVHKVVIGTVKGDLHDIGKNLVAMMLRGANFEVIDLGTDVPADKFVKSVRTTGAKLVGLSALLTTTLPSMRATVGTLEAAELEGVSIMVGGAPVTQKYADEIGAHGFAPDAATAVDLARKLAAVGAPT